MGFVSTDKDRDLSEHEIVYEHPDAQQLLAVDARTRVVLESGSSVEAMCGLVALVLAVIGIAGHEPFTMGGVATIVVGFALLAQGGAVASRWRASHGRLAGTRSARQELVGGMGVEVVGGIVGIVLGVLTLAGVMPILLLPVAAIVFGGALLLGGAAQPEFANLAAPTTSVSVQQAVETSGGIMVLVGIAAAVLGILALLAVGPMVTLALIAIVCIGGALVFAGGALATRFMRRYAGS
jgi:hypothetical protein